MNNLANTKQTEITGGNVNYYLINIPHPRAKLQVEGGYAPLY